MRGGQKPQDPQFEPHGWWRHYTGRYTSSEISLLYLWVNQRSNCLKMPYGYQIWWEEPPCNQSLMHLQAFICYGRRIQMWRNQAKWVWSRSNSILIFLIDCTSFSKLPFTTDPIEIGHWFKRQRQLKGSKRKQTNYLLWLYLKDP